MSFDGGFTVLMPVYRGDGPEMFARAVSSVYDNSLQPDQFLIVVDGPVGPAVDAVLADAARRGAEILRMPQNIGLSRALNAALPHVRHAWIVRADADDFNLPDRFCKQAAFSLRHPDLAAFGGQILEVDALGAPIAKRIVPSEPSEVRRRLPSRNPINHMTACIRADAIRRLNGYPEVHLKEDYALWVKLVSAGQAIGNLPDVVVHATSGLDMYRRRGGVRYITSEIKMQQLLVQSSVTPLWRALLVGMVRSLVFALPSRWRGLVYRYFLRKKVETSNAP
jgi:glycosyltransferase involved in cell wall biosynthesis